MVDLPYMAKLRSNVPAGTEVGQSPIWNGTIHIPMRNAIVLNADPNFATDDTARILAAANQRTGAWVHLADGKYKVGVSAGSGTALDLRSTPKGTTITGAPRGLKSGDRLYNDGNPNVGTTLYVYNTGKCFDLGEQMHLEGLCWYYPNQAINGTPTAYGWTINITQHGCSAHNCTTENSYDFISIASSVGGADVDKIWGFPLHKGIYLGRVTDVARIRSVNFNPAANWQTAVGSGSTIPTWVLANGDAFIVDGAELFQFSQCFAYGYATGFKSDDLDGDSFRGATGHWEGGGFDSCTLGMRFTRGMWQGMTMSGCAFAPLPGSYGILFEDTTTPGAPWERAKLDLIATKTAGVHYRTVQMATGAYGVCNVIGGQYFGGPSSAHFGNDSANATIILNGPVYDTSYQLLGGTGEIIVNSMFGQS